MKQWACLFLLLAWPLVAEGETPSPAAQVVWHFDGGIVNDFGGKYNVFKREPSWARTYLDSRVTRARRGHSLRITARREAKGFCGVWLDFRDGSEVPRRFLDAGSLPYLSFWAKGERGGEDFEISITDEATLDSEDRPSRKLRAYLPGGLSTKWRQVIIPLSDFRGLDASRLVRMTLKLTRQGDSRFYLDDIALQRAPVANPPPKDPAAARKSASDSPPRAMWAWNTKPLFDPGKPQGAERFLSFCAAQRIGTVYLAAEFDRVTVTENVGLPLLRLRKPEGYRAFLRLAHQQGLTVAALAGTPEWAIRANHPEALAAVDAIIAFHQGSSPEERFDGVHFDVEPYLLIGFEDPDFRSEILLGLIEAAEKCGDRAHQEALTFSCDLPSWFYSARGPERNRLMVNFKGREKPVGEHLTDMVDSITIMDYTNQADGAGGIIARALPALHYAASRNKKIVVGVETFAERDSRVAFILGLPAKEFWRRLAESGLRGQLHYEDFRMSLKTDGVNVHLGLSTPRDLTPERQAAFEAALARLARRFGASFEPERYSLREILNGARAAFAKNPDWKDFEPCEYPDSECGGTIQGFRSTRRMQPSITFHGLGRETFEEEIASTVEWLGGHPSFGGIAVHFYDSFRDLIEGEKPEPATTSQDLATGGN